jgi:hypothetical protein
MVELVSVNHCPKACEIPRGDRVLPTVLYNPQISASLVQDACRMYGDTVLQYLTVGEAIRNTVQYYCTSGNIQATSKSTCIPNGLLVGLVNNKRWIMMLSRRTKGPLLDRGPWLVGKSNGSRLASRLWILNKLKDMGTVWYSGYSMP